MFTFVFKCSIKKYFTKLKKNRYQNTPNIQLCKLYADQQRAVFQDLFQSS